MAPAVDQETLKESFEMAVEATPLQAPAMDKEKDESEEMSDWDLLVDKFNNRGGIIVGTVACVIGGIGIKNLFQLYGVDELQSGIYTTGVTMVGLLAWTFTYFTRVATKSTTYAEQLKQYEQAVMIRRLEELTDEEIEALCAEVGVSEADLQEAMSETQKETAETKSQKEKVLALFKAAPVTAAPTDPRMGF